jgi:hypothetical protein
MLLSASSSVSSECNPTCTIPRDQDGNRNSISDATVQCSGRGRHATAPRLHTATRQATTAQRLLPTPPGYFSFLDIFFPEIPCFCWIALLPLQFTSLRAEQSVFSCNLFFHPFFAFFVIRQRLDRTTTTLLSIHPPAWPTRDTMVPLASTWVGHPISASCGC